MTTALEFGLFCLTTPTTQPPTEVVFQIPPLSPYLTTTCEKTFGAELQVLKYDFQLKSNQTVPAGVAQWTEHQPRKHARDKHRVMFSPSLPPSLPLPRNKQTNE